METPEIISGADAAKTAETCAAYGLTETEFAELRRRATAAKATAYCVYSQFRVGATLLASDGSFISGANVENASYPVGTCAERVALGTAVTGGFRDFKALAVATDISPPASPCGMCRQFIREFCSLDTPILMFDKNEDYVVLRFKQLLPMSFGPDQLPRPGTLGTA
ncbi:cytidine deaminase-like protein [Ilyonectria robusta]|uniref:cytidine deaminase-like protein n=1 Tax=Ilyonectria robusta TaxID=1079257 RepID=UPI001E8D9314|nr:cytidine deaminase-like protein [Ilyonectria robusta]KAH8737369.1 cytidine deaminase-like protein [Ilyonectria robusta]